MFKKIASLLLLLMLVAAPASSTLVTIPYVFIPNTPIYSGQVNSDFSTLAGVINGGIDNTNVGVAGFYASQIVPTNTTQATFGGSVGYVFNPGAAGVVPLTLEGAPSQSADLFDVFSPYFTTKYVWVDSSGVLHANQAPAYATPLSIASGGTGSATQNFVDLTSAQTVGGAKAFSSYLTDTAGGAWLTGSGGGTASIYQTTQNTGGNLYLGLESIAGGSIFTGSTGYAGVLGTSSGYPLQFATNTTVRETISGTGAASFTSTLSAAGLTSTAGVAAGGAITGATTGAFSSTVTAASFATTGNATIYNNAAINGTFGALSITGATSSYVRLYLGSSATNFGVFDEYTGAGNITEIYGGGSAVSGVTGTELNIDRFNGSTYLALDSSGNLGLLGTLKLGTALGVAYGGTGSTTQNFVDLTTGQTVAGVKTFSSAPVSANGFTAGSSTYGATSASVNGTIAGSSSGTSTTTYHPPMYVNGTTAIANTVHSIYIASVTTSGTPNSGCPPHGTWTSTYCTSVTIAPAFANTGISSTGNSGNTMPTNACGGQAWVPDSTHLFIASVSETVSVILDDTTPNTLYAISNAASYQAGPIICTGY